ncbi:hypothetical protein CkaCkLH20_07818 [Colletotrichum karsti]|uniref:Uncharacterized protein n=1 Tax=Colletotrichum karsti TaxID=1095194 RepID=A0A9P6LJ04_9PEZI|nr:uncharacterized protein CkaCkLH20_07818 [Colletotrichum karsti]KAF9874681.1 hypothetical protein CkaCkLH20_07818 [Colletotrichum karsti]
MIRDDPNLGYKMRVLAYDLRNVTKNHSSTQRLNTTTDEHYISEPYFTPEEAASIKSAVVDVEFNQNLDPNARYEQESPDESTDVGDTSTLSASHVQGQTVENALKMLLENFLEKRKASGDTRPCGPHDLTPVYVGLFGLCLADLQDHKFLNRLARSGV